MKKGSHDIEIHTPRTEVNAINFETFSNFPKLIIDIAKILQYPTDKK